MSVSLVSLCVFLVLFPPHSPPHPLHAHLRPTSPSFYLPISCLFFVFLPSSPSSSFLRSSSCMCMCLLKHMEERSTSVTIPKESFPIWKFTLLSFVRPGVQLPHRIHHMKVRGQFVEISSLFLPCVSGIEFRLLDSMTNVFTMWSIS